MLVAPPAEPAAEQGCQECRALGRDLAEEQCSPVLPEQGHHSMSGDSDRGSRDRGCQTGRQGLGTSEARPGSQVRGLWSPGFPGIPAGCFWQGPRNEASPTALCLAPDGCAQAAPSVLAMGTESQSAGTGKGLLSPVVRSGQDSQDVLSLTMSGGSTVL